MCWYGKLLSKQVAKKDIHCKKVIAYNPKDKFYFPYYIRHGKIKRYEIGKTYTSDIEVKNITFIMHSDYYCDIYKGIHCYSWDVDATVEANKLAGSVIIVIDKKGRRDCYSFSFDKSQTRYPILVDCIIPKGATYYKNDYGEIVTDKLQIVGIIRLTDKPDNYD